MKLSFHGAVRGVTGSCHRIVVKDADGVDHQYLFDCGMFQGEQMCGTKNLDDFGFDPKEIEGVFVSHPHADHVGRLPKLVKEGFAGKIYMVEPCEGLSKLVLDDAHHIMVEDAEKCGSSVLYELEDLHKAFEQVETLGYHEAFELAPGVKVVFRDAGHVLGSAWITLEAEGKKVVFSGDIGNDNVPILPDTVPIESADVIITESTYGQRQHEDVSERREKLKQAIEKVINDRGVLMIPAFSIERTQELLYEIDRLLLNELKTKMPIYLDSPMAIKATHLYRTFKNYLKFDAPILSEPDRDFFSFPNLRETLTVAESKYINDAPLPKIIIAGSGMMSGGRIMHHLMRYLGDSKNQLLIIGYQAQGTVGRQLFDGAKKVRIHGKDVDVHAQISAIGAFSGHGDMYKLAKWLQPTDGSMPKKVFLVHGDPEAKEGFAEHLRKELPSEVIIPGWQEEFEI